ncbi:hypothetical protein F2Q70_00018876 [Brassica cretica]|uniref:S-protein homolog n=1 Tax=Brassica cretica TaxID=69181 RepID=A0A8S9I120_BRACR|nr:hypothetical protein F2Q70_00018876 [Brassica cretica]
MVLDTKQMNYFVLFILVTSTYFGINEACKKNQVEIHNQLGPGKVLQFHCRSGDDDIGVKTLNFNAVPYIIRFHDEIPNLTKWDCILRQGPKMEYSYDVQVYKAGPRLIPRCGQLRVWTAKIDGIYFTRKLSLPSGFALSWNKG